MRIIGVFLNFVCRFFSFLFVVVKNPEYCEMFREFYIFVFVSNTFFKILVYFGGS